MRNFEPLKFQPIFKPVIWGGTRLRPFLGAPTRDEPTGEAWMLSDVDGSISTVADGPYAGLSLRDLIRDYRPEILGKAALSNDRFPLLMKFLDAKTELSVQVHPTDEQAAARKPGALGKTEAWVVLDANPMTSRLYAGFRIGTTKDSFLAAMAEGTTPSTLHHFTPKAGDCVFLEAGTVHAIGRDLLLFEVQQTSDITYRLYDWDRVDPKTGQSRELHLDDGLECSNFALGPCDPVIPENDHQWDRLVACRYFTLHHRRDHRSFSTRTASVCRVIVVLESNGAKLVWEGGDRSLIQGDVLLLPACLGPTSIQTQRPIRLLEIGLVE